MAHVRQQLRAYVSEMIKGSALVASRVQPSRARPVRRDAQPSAYVYTPSESSSDIDSSGAQQRVIRLKIDTIAKGDEADVQDDFDGFAVHVETAIAADPLFGGIASASEYKTTSFSSNADGEKPFSIMSMVFDVIVLTSNSNPEIAL